MKQRIYDTRRQAIVDFEPLTPGTVGMYVCGPTVQSAPHIGHLRSALVYDQIRRWFTATGYRVTLIRNVTDIDDKILERASHSQQQNGQTPRPSERPILGSHSSDDRGPEPWWALAYRIEREFTAAYDAIGVLPPIYEPRATANIAEMIALTLRLIERGHAYQPDQRTANVYFDTSSWPEYGALTRQRPEAMEATEAETQHKRNPQDFALWKAHRAHEPLSASWPSPWGRGRPGWHIECSAMATRYLGESFDIHGGGLDLRFPHHENELAQSAAAGYDFASYWIHNGLVHTGGQKMSKSLGNSLFAAELLAAAKPIVLRYFLGSAHYRSVLEFSESSLAEAETAFSRIEGFLKRAQQYVALPAPPNGSPTGLSAEGTVQSLPQDFIEAMLDDFRVPRALAVLHGTVTAGNTAIDLNDTDTVRQHAAEVTAMLDVLGLNPNGAPWQHGSETLTARHSVPPGAASAPEQRALEALIAQLLTERRTARAAKDFASSDAIRDRLTAAGITLEDGPHHTHWSLT